MTRLCVFKGDRPRLDAELEEQFSAFSPFEVEVVVWQENGAVGAVGASRFKSRAVPGLFHPRSHSNL